VLTPAPARPAPATAEEAPAPLTPASRSGALARGRQLTALLYGGQLEELWEAFLPSAQAEWGDLGGFEAYRASGLESYGEETSLLHEAVIEDDGVTSYVRTVTFEGAPGQEWTVVFSLDDQGSVVDFRIVAAP